MKYKIESKIGNTAWHNDRYVAWATWCKYHEAEARKYCSGPIHMPGTINRDTREADDTEGAIHATRGQLIITLRFRTGATRNKIPKPKLRPWYPFD